MTHLRVLFIGVLAVGILLIAASSASATTLTITEQRFTGRSLGLVALVKGGLTLKFALVIAGTIRSGTYAGTLGVTAWSNIATMSPTTCAASSTGFTITCLPGPWTIDMIGVAGNGLVVDFNVKDIGLLFNDTSMIRCLLRGNLRGRYDRNTRLFSFAASMTSFTATPLSSGTCPMGTPGLVGSLAITPSLILGL